MRQRRVGKAEISWSAHNGEKNRKNVSLLLVGFVMLLCGLEEDWFDLDGYYS